MLAVAGVVAFGTGAFDGPTGRPATRPASAPPTTAAPPPSASPTTPAVTSGGSEPTGSRPRTSPSVRPTRKVNAPTASDSPSPDPGTASTLPGADRMVLVAAPADGSGKRLLTAGSGGSVDASGTAAGERTRWVVVPVSPGAERYLVKTVRLVAGEPECLADTQGGDLTVTACDAGDDAQLFQWDAREGGFALMAAGGMVAITERAVTVTLDDATTFTLTDSGPYTSPF